MTLFWRHRTSNGLLALLLAFSVLLATASQSAEPSVEYKLKAGFLFRFLAFTEWPEQRSSSNDDHILIGILGNSPLSEVIGQIQGRTINDRIVEIKELDANAPTEELKKCWLLFIPTAQSANLSHIIQKLKGSPVLVVTETLGTIPNEAMITFIPISAKIGFNINKNNADQVGIEFRSKLLRLATNAEQLYADE